METALPNIASILFFLTFAVYSFLVLFMLVWLYHDAESRGVMGWVILVPAFLTGTILGTVLWLVFRPSLKLEPVPVRVRNN
ncbi:hypothetical protein [uncultured Pontibacter sp.]|uniref:hypothetical protein n=1 Tax=uncultured Pontibacter sp. TaxID=453356 RepID=UPI0026203B8E|nr:hypothetical protein [uncultured Pontibacter sp.]